MKKFEQINVIPFIDIMLVLLAIVLMTATFIAQDIIKINLPQAENSESISSEKAIEISIDAQQSFYFGEQPINLHQLDINLAKLDRTTTIILRVDKAVLFENFVAIVDLLKKYQLDKLAIMTK